MTQSYYEHPCTHTHFALFTLSQTHTADLTFGLTFSADIVHCKACRSTPASLQVWVSTPASLQVWVSTLASLQVWASTLASLQVWVSTLASSGLVVSSGTKHASFPFFFCLFPLFLPHASSPSGERSHGHVDHGACLGMGDSWFCFPFPFSSPPTLPG